MDNQNNPRRINIMLDDFTLKILDDLGLVLNKSRSQLVRQLVEESAPMLIELAATLKPLEKATHEERLKIYHRLEQVHKKLTSN